MDITEVAKQSGTPSSTLRFYEKKELIRSIGREGLHRQFHPRVLEQLDLIALGRSAGLSLDEIGTMLVPEGKLKIDRELLIKKADELDASIRKLSTMRDGLRHAAACSAPSHMECSKFRRLLGLVAISTKGRNKKNNVSKKAFASDSKERSL